MTWKEGEMGKGEGIPQGEMSNDLKENRSEGGGMRKNRVL